MSYIIKDIKFLESSKGNKYARVTLSDGKEVAIFDKFPNFVSLKAGDVVDGDLSKKEYNGKESFTLNPLKGPSTFATKGNTAAINKAMDKKNENIKEAQSRKDESIKLAAIQRDAVLLVSTYYPEANQVFENKIPEKEKYLQLRITEWKKWLEQNYGDGQPF